ncbi:MAG TPA: iron ABC transporter permease [Clostridia bacterium]|nr:iron ABC transporter permease [Clostridia bacterium]
MIGRQSVGKTSSTLIVVPLVVLLGITLILGMGLGSTRIPPMMVLKALFDQPEDPEMLSVKVGAMDLPYDQAVLIVRAVRLPRVLLAAVVGSALAMSGVAFQGVLANPMADPYVIGVSAGAALGATLGMILGFDRSLGGFSAVPAAAFAGSLAAMLGVYLIASAAGRGKASVMALLLAGISMSTILSAFVSLLMVLRRARLEKIFLWLMGGLSNADWRYLPTCAGYVIFAGTFLCLYSRDLNAMAFGEEVAGHLGVNPERAKGIVVFLASLMTAASVAVTGLIGFVGLLVPHITRFIVGPDNRRVLPASGLIGASLLVGADTIARTIMAPAEIPVGIITALIGGPFFLFLLYREKRVV